MHAYEALRVLIHVRGLPLFRRPWAFGSDPFLVREAGRTGACRLAISRRQQSEVEVGVGRAPRSRDLIARSMGVTKQAAQKRFVRKGPGEPSDLDPSQGFSRFTERARNVVMAAQNEARAADNNQIRPEHLVLGLLSEPDALAAVSIVAQGVQLETVRPATTATLPPAADQVPALIPYDSRARKALELTFRQALRMGHKLHRYRAHPARAAGTRRRHGRARRPRTREGTGVAPSSDSGARIPPVTVSGAREDADNPRTMMRSYFHERDRLRLGG
jgi:hypothetical protein